MEALQQIHSSAKIRKGVILDGSITIGENTFIGSGTVITAKGEPIEIGANTVIMENAVIRSSPKFNCRIGDNVLVGPKACITGAIIGNGCFIATNGTVFHGSLLEKGTVLAVNGIIHVDSHCPENTFIPINHIAFGKPVKIYSPSEIKEFHADLRNAGGFVKYVYDIDPAGLSNTEIYKKLTEKYLSMLQPE